MSEEVRSEMSMPATSTKILRAAWVVAMVAVLLSWLSGNVSDPPATALSGERHLLALLMLVALTFPLGLAWALVLNLTAYLMASTGQAVSVPDAWLALAVWFGFFVLGYLQWFKLIPSLLRRWRARSAA